MDSLVPKVRLGYELEAESTCLSRVSTSNLLVYQRVAGRRHSNGGGVCNMLAKPTDQVVGLWQGWSAVQEPGSQGARLQSFRPAPGLGQARIDVVATVASMIVMTDQSIMFLLAI